MLREKLPNSKKEKVKKEKNPKKRPKTDKPSWPSPGRQWTEAIQNHYA
ncbi:MAG: hypothetical protein ACTSYA_13035 [Candidatus Kariarchaeaceae archaeon]